MENFYCSDDKSNTAVNVALHRWVAGLITDEELVADLDLHNVHGGIDSGGFTGYDYNLQCWISTN